MLEKLVANEADALTDRCLKALLPIRAPDQRHLVTSLDKWIESRPGVIPIRELLGEAFTCALKLRRGLQLTERYSEFYSPVPGLTATENCAVTTDDSIVEAHHVIDLCLMPAVVEYDPGGFMADGMWESVLCGEQNLISATEVQRRKGRVVRPSVVVLDETHSR